MMSVRWHSNQNEFSMTCDYSVLGVLNHVRASNAINRSQHQRYNLEDEQKDMKIYITDQCATVLSMFRSPAKQYVATSSNYLPCAERVRLL